MGKRNSSIFLVAFSINDVKQKKSREGNQKHAVEIDCFGANDIQKEPASIQGAD